MTLENCKRLLAHYEEQGMSKEAADMRRCLEGRGVEVSAKQSEAKVKKGLLDKAKELLE